MDLNEIKVCIRNNQYKYNLHTDIERKADELTLAQVEEALLNGKILMSKIQCNFCGSGRYEERRIDYLYSYKGQYLLGPNTPVEVCLNCGMIYYDAPVLKEIERRFFAIQRNSEQPDDYIQMSVTVYA